MNPEAMVPDIPEMGLPMSAAEVLAQHWMDEDQDCVKCNRHFNRIAEFAAHQLDALKAAGYSIVPPGPQFVLEFDYRTDNGPHHVGPFPSREAAFEWAYTDVGAGSASYHAYPITSPDAAEAGR